MQVQLQGSILNACRARSELDSELGSELNDTTRRTNVDLFIVGEFGFAQKKNFSSTPFAVTPSTSLIHYW